MLVTLTDVLKKAQNEKYAVGLFNTIDMEMANGVLEAAENLSSPVIIGTAEILLPYGGLEELAWLLRPMAERAKVPVVLHFDHGLKEETVYRAIDLGFSSVMYDCSDKSFEDNIKALKEMTKYAHSKGVSVEAELGHVGNAADCDGEDALTDPVQAKYFADETGVDALAVAIGTAHGAYRKKPKLDFARLQKIRETIDVPLVLHGGSGLSEEDFKKTIEYGIAKVNIFTDVNQAAAKAASENYKEGIGMTDLVPFIRKAVQEATENKMRIFGSVNKA
ncbi:MAG: class II fructose-bisphosphate aldolase [Ruminococcaceae bacterium]|nr:class II fructose-bisphosphate aldolase [Oscillospiraceae bacterium]